MKPGSPMQRNYGIGSPNKKSAFKHPHAPGVGEDHPASFNHKSRDENSLREAEMFDPNRAGRMKKDTKRGEHGSSRKDQDGNVFDVTTRTERDRGRGSLDDINLLPEAEVAAPSRKEERQAKRGEKKADRKEKKESKKAGRKGKKEDRKDNRADRKAKRNN